MKMVEALEMQSEPLAIELERKIKEFKPPPSLAISMMRAGAADQEMLKELLGFLEELPRMRGGVQIAKAFNSRMRAFSHNLPPSMKKASRFLSVPGVRGIAGTALKWLVLNKLGEYFIIKGQEDLWQNVFKNAKQGAGTIVDFLGESARSEEEAERAFKRYQRIIPFLGEYFRDVRVLKDRKYIPHIAIKFSSLASYFGVENYNESKEVVLERFSEIIRLAKKHGVFVTVDTERAKDNRLIEDIFFTVITAREFRYLTRVGIALQAYLLNSLEKAVLFANIAEKRGAPFGVRLVKGAYWEEDRDFVFQNKWETDRSFNEILYFFLRNWRNIRVSPATHNPRSIAFAMRAASFWGVIDEPDFNFQVLRALGEPARELLCGLTMPTLVYCAVSSGNMGADMAFFARRIRENTSNQGILASLLK